MLFLAEGNHAMLAVFSWHEASFPWAEWTISPFPPAIVVTQGHCYGCYPWDLYGSTNSFWYLGEGNKEYLS